MEKVYIVTNEESGEIAICPTIEDAKKVMINNIISEFFDFKEMVKNVEKWNSRITNNHTYIEYFSIKEIHYNTFTM